MSENKTGKYFKYAIGEIILVVIGILIALSINNWNEARKEQNELLNIYEDVKTDLLNDLQESRYIMEWWKKEEVKVTNFIAILESDVKILDSIPKDDIVEGISQWPFAITNRAFKKLNDRKSKLTEEDKAIAKQLNKLYVENYELLKSSLQNFNDLAVEYLKELYKTYDWMPLGEKGVYSEARQYFLNNLTHRRHLKRYRGYGNAFVRDISSHHQEALIAYAMIHQLTSPEKQLPDILLESNPVFSKTERQEFKGIYKFNDSEITIEDHNGLLLLKGDNARDIYSDEVLMLRKGKDSIGFLYDIKPKWFVKRNSKGKIEGIDVIQEPPYDNYFFMKN